MSAPEDTLAPPTSARWASWPLYAAIAASFLNLFLQLPVTPVLARALTTDLMAVALAVSAYSIANLVGNLFAGLVVDRFPKAPVLSAGVVLGGLALAAAGQFASLPWLVGCLMLNGLAFSVVTPAAYALLAQTLPPETRARGMAGSGALIGLAALVGPPSAGRLADAMGEGGAYRAIGLAIALAGLALWAALPKDSGAEADGAGLGDLWDVLKSSVLAPAFAAAFALMFANGSLVFALPPTVKAMGASGAITGALFSAFAIAAIAVFLTPLGRRAYGGGLGAIGAGIIALSLVGLSLAGTIPLMAVAMTVYGIGFGLLFPAGLSLLVAGAPPERRGTAFGLFYAFFSLGAIAGPFALARTGAIGWKPFLVAAIVPALYGTYSLIRQRTL